MCPARKSAWKCVRNTYLIEYPPLLRVTQVLRDIALWIDHYGGSTFFVGNEVGRVRQTAQVVLLDDHGRASLDTYLTNRRPIES